MKDEGDDEMGRWVIESGVEGATAARNVKSGPVLNCRRCHSHPYAPSRQGGKTLEGDGFEVEMSESSLCQPYDSQRHKFAILLIIQMERN
ncbi:hypothetical protein MLD38_021712 [Melastoma candidum]|uniref:Uncharacterized protein n=1 Tax=Melastoma candidum TaxID=119954 RepID=A0ACB9QJV8_9MYRT|nr:hypothetical protein MLD38_021712 [Melastoma candidum]